MIVLLLACSGPSETAGVATPVEPRGPLDLRATDWPSHWLATRVGGEHVEVTCILPEGQDPQHWQPSGDLVAGLGEADLIVTNGAFHSAWMKTASLPGMKVLETGDTVDLIVREGETHSHGAEGEHSHGEIDPHTWTDPKVFSEQAGALRAGLTMLDPEHAEDYSANAAAVRADLDALHEDYVAATADLAEVTLRVEGDGYGYLARRYQLKLVDHDHEGAVPVVLDPLVSGAPYDYLAQSRANVAALEGAVE